MNSIDNPVTVTSTRKYLRRCSTSVDEQFSRLGIPNHSSKDACETYGVHATCLRVRPRASRLLRLWITDPVVVSNPFSAAKEYQQGGLRSA